MLFKDLASATAEAIGAERIAWLQSLPTERTLAVAEGWACPIAGLRFTSEADPIVERLSSFIRFRAQAIRDSRYARYIFVEAQSSTVGEWT